MFRSPDGNYPLPPMDTSKIAVLGAGTMGAGIAQTAAEAGHQVTLIDTNQEAVDRGMASIDAILERKVEKGRASRDEVD